MNSVVPARAVKLGELARGVGQYAVNANHVKPRVQVVDRTDG